MLEERETEAQKVRYEIETRARTNLVAAQGEAKAQEQLATAYRDNRAVLGYELARRRLDVGAALAEQAPRPVIVQTDGSGGDSSALSTLLMAQLIPSMVEGGGSRRSSVEVRGTSLETTPPPPSARRVQQAAGEAAAGLVQRAGSGAKGDA